MFAAPAQQEFAAHRRTRRRPGQPEGIRPQKQAKRQPGNQRALSLESFRARQPGAKELRREHARQRHRRLGRGDLETQSADAVKQQSRERGDLIKAGVGEAGQHTSGGKGSIQ